jgi:mannose-6-phosphate isomerase-like protein (cupin superfamily)
VGIFEDEVLPESGPPPHLHRSQDETHYILEGQFEFVLGERKVNAGAGSVVYVPRTTVHPSAWPRPSVPVSCYSRITATTSPILSGRRRSQRVGHET